MRFVVVVVTVLVFVSASCAADWPHWRGPVYNGSTSETGLPSSWSTTENVAWSADLPGPSAATPIISGDHVFVSSTDLATSSLKALCLDRETGDLKWQQTVSQQLRRDTRSTFAAPSPVTNGEMVIFFYGNGDLLAFDFKGSKLWSRNLQDDYGDFAFLWTFSSSPLLLGDKLYLQVLQRDVPVERRRRRGGRSRGRRQRETSTTRTTYTAADRGIESYLLALEPSTGETIWRHARPSQAVAESREAFSSPIPYQRHGQDQLLVAGGDDLTAHDAQTGKEIWRWGTWNPTRIGHWRLVPSPVAGDDVILVCAPKRDPIYAVRPGGPPSAAPRLAWSTEEDQALSSDVPTPAFAEGDFFVLSDVQRTLARVDPQTGQAKWKVPTPGREKYEASPLVADGKIYAVNFSGEVAVFDSADGKLVAQVPMDPVRSEHVVRSSIAAAHGQLFVRTTTKLFCIGQ